MGLPAGCADTASCLRFHSPANLEQLFVPPDFDSGSTHPFAWLVAQASAARPDEPRGWRGPYLKSNLRPSQTLRIGSALAGDGSGDPAGGRLVPVVGQPDGRGTCPEGCEADPLYCWSAGGGSPVQRARPILFIADASYPRVVAFGADGRYDGPAPGNPCRPPDGSDDIVICL